MDVSATVIYVWDTCEVCHMVTVFGVSAHVSTVRDVREISEVC